MKTKRLKGKKTGAKSACLERLVRPFPALGDCWWDMDEKMNVGIECENPPHDKHYLLTFKTDKKDSSGTVAIAQAMVDWLNGRSNEPGEPCRNE